MQFPKPFRGKSSPLSISGLFLFDPSVLTKLDGMPFRSLLEEKFGAALYKRMDRAMKQHAVTVELVDDLLSEMPDNGNPFVEMMRAAHAGDAEAALAVEVAGVWESFFAGFEGPPGYSGLYRLAIERASRKPMEALRRGNFDAALAQLLSDPVTGVLLWPEAVAALDGDTTIEHLAPLQFAVAIEVELSCLAALDTQHQIEGGLADSALSVLLPEEGSALNPAALFFRWIMRSVGAASMGELEKTLQRIGRSINLVTLKNWNRGAHLPSVQWLKLIVQLKPVLADGDKIWILHWAARVLMLLGYYGTLCTTRVSAEQRSVIRARQRPWPAFPHGHAEFDGWLRARYPAWLAYHRARIRTAPL